MIKNILKSYYIKLDIKKTNKFKQMIFKVSTEIESLINNRSCPREKREVNKDQQN